MRAPKKTWLCESFSKRDSQNPSHVTLGTFAYDNWQVNAFQNLCNLMLFQDQRIKIESQTHGDILQERFEDSYRNLTIKTMLLLKWYNQNCGHVPYLLKADDDVFINIKNLYKMVSQNTKADILIGYLFCNSKPIRDEGSKWNVCRFTMRTPTQCTSTAQGT